MRNRVRQYGERIRSELERAFLEEHTAHEIAASFSVGVFVTVLPTLGTGLLLFLFIVAVVDRVSKIALFASVLVFNPMVKWGVYATSFWLGVRILGPLPSATGIDISMDASPQVIARLLVGNVILAVILAVAGYVVCLKLVREFRRRDVEVLEDVVEDVVEEYVES